jgi:dihydroxyacid dehydratase/phosphogluconate dehydratase
MTSRPNARLRRRPSALAAMKLLALPAVRAADVEVGDGKLRVTGSARPEMLGATMAMKVAGLKKAALITDGRFSGATSGPFVGNV